MYEPWLRSSNSSWVNAPQNLEVHNLKVQQLMMPSSKQWDESKIMALFPTHVAQDILAVPLLDTIDEDKLIWKEEKNRMYTVRSGYKKLMREKGAWRNDIPREPWGLLWKIKAPQKAKHLLWRICKECLPIRQHEPQSVFEIWQPPPLGKLKCNVDASFFNNLGACGWGWCIRGGNGQFILAGSNILYETLNITEGEALAIK
ncbi:hypothetical protein TSUD_144160 [Trifolium subterraneum]|uniref:Reverse transcriptase zinc-binding domain-containing protein n=1 Tax=Trifolium subterraneum TaxID=3900 RepID=A0A2Z6NG58_TRISU|nr:hypothetical protein TSUD_144160 [Trifolium subterraneum]